MAVVDINKNFLYNPVRPAFWEVDVPWSIIFQISYQVNKVVGPIKIELENIKP